MAGTAEPNASMPGPVTEDRILPAVRFLKEMKQKASAETDPARRQSLELACAQRAEWRTLYEHFGPKLDYLAYKFGLNKDDRDDVVQEIFKRVFCHIHTLREVEKFNSWFREIARNEMRRFIHRHLPPESLEQLQDSSGRSEVLAAEALEHNSPQENAFARLLTEQLEDCIKRLPERMQETVVLYYVEGCSQREVARIMQVAIPTVKEQLQRARKLLWECLAQYGWERVE